MRKIKRCNCKLLINKKENWNRPKTPIVKDLLPANYGNRALQIASLKVDSFRTNESIYDSIQNIANKVDIACMQETHYGRCGNIQIADYAIVVGGQMLKIRMAVIQK